MKTVSNKIAFIRVDKRNYEILQIEGAISFSHGQGSIGFCEYHSLGKVHGRIVFLLAFALVCEKENLPLSPAQIRLLKAWRAHKETTGNRTWNPQRIYPLTVD